MYATAVLVPCAVVPFSSRQPTQVGRLRFDFKCSSTPSRTKLLVLEAILSWGGMYAANVSGSYAPPYSSKKTRSKPEADTYYCCKIVVHKPAAHKGLLLQ